MINNPDDGRMPFLDHLVELRNRLLRSLGAVLLGFCAAYYFAKPIFRLLMEPYNQAYRSVYEKDPILIHTGLMEPFLVYLKVGLLSGVFLVSPYIFYQLWRFIAPGLKEKERKHGLQFVIVATIMFIGGALFGYFGVFPVGFAYFLELTQGEAIEPMIRMQEYYQISSWMMIVFGLAFEVPLLVIYLVLFGLVSAEQLRRSWRAVLVGIFVASALLTPADPLSMLMLAAPMGLLYGLTTYLAGFIEKREQEGQGQEANEN